jgi:RNA polymerase sigma-70 factor (ECF subfamily)
MGSTDSTCWTILRDAAAGDREARELFAARYAPMVRAYLSARWRGSPLSQEVDDAVQEVFVECLKHDGALGRVSDDRPGGFRAFFYGLVRNVAWRVERTRARRREEQPAGTSEAVGLVVAESEESLSHAFDRAWARMIMREAAERQAARAATSGDAARRRVELLRLRFQEGLPIRAIARRWGVEPAALHHEYARARAEFRDALLDVMASYHPDAPGEAERDCRDLLTLLD